MFNFILFVVEGTAHPKTCSQYAYWMIAFVFILVYQKLCDENI